MRAVGKAREPGVAIGAARGVHCRAGGGLCRVKGDDGAWEDSMDELRAGFFAVSRRLDGASLLRPGLSPAAAGELAWALTSVAVWEHLRLDRGWSARTTERRLADMVVLALTGTL
jgi:hypothetical protein